MEKGNVKREDYNYNQNSELLSLAKYDSAIVPTPKGFSPRIVYLLPKVFSKWFCASFTVLEEGQLLL